MHQLVLARDESRLVHRPTPPRSFTLRFVSNGAQTSCIYSYGRTWSEAAQQTAGECVPGTGRDRGLRTRAPDRRE